MTSFDDRQKGYEADFKREQELAFRITARRNKLLGLWAAERLGLPAGEATEEYARSVVLADFEAPGDADVVAKVRGDFLAKGIAIGEAEIGAELARAAIQARQQLAKP
jgi:hypothetical protein